MRFSLCHCYDRLDATTALKAFDLQLLKVFGIRQTVTAAV